MHIARHLALILELEQVGGVPPSAWQWSAPYWRLMDPEAAAVHDARVAAAETELAAIEAALDAQEPKKP